MQHLEPVQKILKDTKQAAKTMSSEEARFLVDQYYITQEDRKRGVNQVRSMGDEPHETIAHFAEQARIVENQIKVSLDLYSESQPIGEWMRSVKGIGPVIAAGLIAHIDIEKAPTVGHIWRYAGLDPTSKWEKGQKRPWNASLKVLCWKVGQSFVKVSGGENPGFYGGIYRKRKAYEVAKNSAGDYADQAAAKLEKFKIGKTTDAYKAYSIGQLPPAHIDQRSQRYATKLFLSHMHGKWYEIHHGKPAPNPYPIDHLGHVHLIEAA